MNGVCTRKGCSEPAAEFVKSTLCAMHYRFMGMCCQSRIRGKYTPTYDELKSLLDQNPAMICPHCGVQMNWLQDVGVRSQLTLQHYKNGAIGLICYSCNCRHSQAPDDSFFYTPAGVKRCPKCGTNKPFHDFHKDRRLFLGLKSHCKLCSKADSHAYRLRKLSRKAA